MLSWDRSLPQRPGGELSVNRGWDYGDLQPWLDGVVAEYERTSSWIKRWALKERISESKPPIYRYVSRS
jgi:hypothetical protein